jgi:hypothetical protein
MAADAPFFCSAERAKKNGAGANSATRSEIKTPHYVNSAAFFMKRRGSPKKI